MSTTDKPDTTTETLFGGDLKIRQRREGYRFSMDSPILAYHVSLGPGEVGVDLGTGCGVIPLIVAKRFPSAILYGIEIQDDLAELASRNVEANHMAGRVRIIHGDMKNSRMLLGCGVADVVFSNPPYRPQGSGRLSPNSQRTIAKHEVSVSLFDVMSAAQVLLKASGRVWVIYPARRLVDVVTQMRACGLEPKCLRLVYSRARSEAELVVVEGVKGGNPGVRILPSLVTHETDGGLTEEMRRIIHIEENGT